MGNDNLLEDLDDGSKKKKHTDPKNFSQWLIGNKKYFLFLISILPVIVTNLWGLIQTGKLPIISNIDPQGLLTTTTVIQCLFILVVIFLPTGEKHFLLSEREKQKDSIESQKKNPKIMANKALMQFKIAWTFVWTSWLLLYTALSAKCLLLSNVNIPKLEQVIKIFDNVFNNCASAAFVICYIIFSRITVKDGEKSGRFLLRWASGMLCLVLVGGVVDVVIGPEKTTSLYGILAGIAMALFIGRLNNKFINPSRFVIACLYSYMAIQTLYPLLVSSNTLINLSLANLAFILKIVFYLFILWIFRSGKLLHCFIETRKLIDKDDWKEFKTSVDFIKPTRDKIDIALDWILKNYRRITYGAIILFLICLPVPFFLYIKKELITILFGASFTLQVSICFLAFFISIYLWAKKKNNKLKTGGKPTEKEKIMIRTYGYCDENNWDRAKRNANTALAQFKTLWIYAWFSWLILYIAYIIKLLSAGDCDNVISFILNPLSNGNSLILLICYLILFEVTVIDDRMGITGKPHWAPWVSLFLFLTFLEVIIRIFAQEYFPSGNLNDFVNSFDWISGIISGIVMALFVGRFDSEFIKPKFIYIFIFYLYMAIQGIYPAFIGQTQATDETRLIISITTMVCKLILFLFVLDLVKSGRLLFYFIRIRKQHDEAENKWEKFRKEELTFTD
jgi:hypothetical protein